MTQRTVFLLVLLLCTLIGAWFFTSFERVTSEEFTGYQGEARWNRFLAATLLLNELGIDAESRSELSPEDWLPDSQDTIITRVTTSISVDSQLDLLYEWISSGGHLVLMPPSQSSPVYDDFLAILGYRLIDIQDTLEDQGDDAPVVEEVAEDEAESGEFDYRLDLDFVRYRIETVIEDQQGATLTDDLGIVAARRALGDGFVTLLASSDYFTNYSIDEADHARFLVDVVAGYIDPGTVWFIYNTSFPSLWEEIWMFAPYAVIGFAIGILIWLWSVTPAFGPPIYSEPPPRRSIVEHVQAAGQFGWRNHGTLALAKSSAAAVMHEAEFRHPGIGRLSPEKQAEQLSKMTGIPAQEILDALVGLMVPRQREFTHNMQSLQQIRKEL